MSTYFQIETHTHIILRVWILGREKEKGERRGRGIDKEVGDGGEEKEGSREGEGKGENGEFPSSSSPGHRLHRACMATCVGD